MTRDLTPWLPATALAIGAFIAFGVRHYRDFNAKHSQRR